MSRIVTNVSYSGPRTKGQSAARLARYLTNRKQEQDRDREHELNQGRDYYETLKLASGDRAQFVQTA